MRLLEALLPLLCLPARLASFDRPWPGRLPDHRAGLSIPGAILAVLLDRQRVLTTHQCTLLACRFPLARRHRHTSQRPGLAGRLRIAVTASCSEE